MDKILGNRVFEVAQIKYSERSLPAYTHAVKPSIDNVTKKKRAGDQLAKKVSKKKKVSTSFDSERVEKMRWTWVLMLMVRRFLVSRLTIIR